MNFRKTGWLKKYVNLRSAQPLLVPALPADNSADAREKSVYSFLQPTGLLYGFPVEFPSGSAAVASKKHLSTADKAQLIFLDCLYGCTMAYQNGDKSTTPSARFKEINHLLLAYFGAIKPAKKAARSGKRSVWAQLFNDQPSEITTLEQQLKNHLNFNAGLTSFSVFFANSLLFLDIYGCMRFAGNLTASLPEKLADIQNEQNQLRITALSLIAAAAHANGTVAKEESQIYFQFLRSANVTSHISAQLREVFDKGITLNEIELPQTSWLVKRYFLEVAILTILADKEVSLEEEEFLLQLCQRLNLPETELEQAMASLQTFLIQHEPSLHFFKNEVRFSYASQSLKTRIGRIISQNKDRILNELKQNSETFALLNKAHTSSLTIAEKQHINQQLHSVLGSIPALGTLHVAAKLPDTPFLQHLLPPGTLPTALHE